MIRSEAARARPRRAARAPAARRAAREASLRRVVRWPRAAQAPAPPVARSRPEVWSRRAVRAPAAREAAPWRAAPLEKAVRPRREAAVRWRVGRQRAARAAVLPRSARP